jgi:hypothetical protein
LETLQYAGGNRFESTALTPDGGILAMGYQEHPGVLDSREGVQGDLVQFDALGKVTRVISSVVSAQTDGPERQVKWAVDGACKMVRPRWINSTWACLQLPSIIKDEFLWLTVIVYRIYIGWSLSGHVQNRWQCLRYGVRR